MASIRKRGSKWQAQIRRLGLAPINRTFTAKDDAVRWAREQDRAIDRGESLPSAPRDLRQTSLSEIIDRYVQEVSTRKRGSVDGYQLRHLSRALGELSLASLKPANLTSYRHQRLNEASPTTVAKEMGLLCHVLKVAADEWGYAITVDKFRAVRKPPASRGRTRRLESDERDRLLEALSACRNPIPHQVFRFAIATAMRRAEILSLVWRNIDLEKRVAFLPITKNGEARKVPLSSQAVEVLQERQHALELHPQDRLPQSHGLIFPTSSNAIRLAWNKARRKAGIEDLRFHDLRHEAISRFFELGLTLLEVRAISGHRDLRMLGHYTHLHAENIAQRLNLLLSQTDQHGIMPVK